MRYVMKQKLFSLGGVFVIKNEQGQEVFWAEGKVFSFGHQLTLRDADGEDDVLILASAIVIDIVRADTQRLSSYGVS